MMISSKSIDTHQRSSEHPLCSLSVFHELHCLSLPESNIMVVWGVLIGTKT